MTLDDFRLVVDVHLMGAVICTKAVWETMRAQNYGRVVMTTSSSGLYGNFGQANYGAAKMALVGLMQTLAIEGEKNDIRVNCLAPTAATQMLEGLLPAEQLEAAEPGTGQPRPAGTGAAKTRRPRPSSAPARPGSSAPSVTLTQGVYLGDRDDAAEAGRRALGRDRRSDPRDRARRGLRPGASANWPSAGLKHSTAEARK